MLLWKGFALGLVLVASGHLGGAKAAEPAPKTATASDIRQWVSDLTHDDYDRRQAATDALAGAGLQAVDALSMAILSDNAEVAWRACAALEQIGLRGDEAAMAKVVDSLAAVKAESHPRLAATVATIRKRHSALRHERAITQIKKFGGQIGIDAPQSVLADTGAASIGEPFVSPELIAPEVDPTVFRLIAQPAVSGAPASAPATGEVAPPPDLPVTEVPPADVAEPAPPPDEAPLTDVDVPADVAVGAAVVEGVVGEIYFSAPVVTDTAGGVEQYPATSLALTKAWSGGDQGLALLRDLPELQQIEINGAELTDAAIGSLAALPNLSHLSVKATGISAAGLWQLRSQRPSLIITAAGPAMLGVSAEMSNERCQVSTVFANSAAAEAGLQPGDNITRVGESKVKTFVDLMIAVYGRQPGEKVTVGFVRQGAQQTALVTLKGRPAP